MKNLKFILTFGFCFTLLFTGSTLAAPIEKGSPQYIADLLKQSDIPIKETLSNFLIETDTHFYTPSDIIRYEYSEMTKDGKKKKVKRIGSGDGYSDLVIEYSTNVQSKYIVPGRESTVLGIYNIDSKYYCFWVLRDENTSYAVKNVILPYTQKLINYFGDQAPDRLELNFCFDEKGEKFPQIEFVANTVTLRDYFSGKITLKELLDESSLSYKLEGKRHLMINTKKILK
ncbi:hypothetical protein SRRS_52380 [Sporomusa rhizae]|uniref:hypothetical protein n=1 Tax=Sporomusa rhizae TaxID=357999 RepID=UPI00352B12E7